MKKILLLCTFLFACSFSSFGQVDTAAVVKEVTFLLDSCKNVAVKGALQEALELNAVVEKLALEKLGTETELYGKIAAFRGNLFYFMGNYEGAEAWWLKSKGIRERVTGKDNREYAANLSNLGVLNVLFNKLEQAEVLHTEAKSIREKLLGKEHPDYKQSLSNLAILYLEMHKFTLAESLFLEAKDLEEKASKQDQPKYPELLDRLSEVYISLGDYDRAIQYSQKAQAIWEKIVGKTDLRYAQSVANQAGHYSVISNYDKAEQLYLEAIPIIEKNSNKADPQYHSQLGNLAAFFIETGKYEQAEAILLEIKAIEEEVFGKTYQAYLTTISNLASLYLLMGNYDKALHLQDEVKEILEQLERVDNADYADALHDLALIHVSMGAYETAVPLYQRAKDIWEKTVGKDHPSYALALDKLALVNIAQNNLAKAELYFLEAKDIRSRSIGKNSREYAESLHNLANLYRDMGLNEKSEACYLEAKTTWENTLGKSHIDYVKNLTNTAILQWHNGNLKSAKQNLLEAESIERSLLTNATYHLSERELSKYVNTFTNDLNLYFSFTHTKAGFSEASYDNVMFHKGFLLNAGARLNASNLSDSSTVETLSQFKACQRQLEKEYVKPISERKNVAELEEKANTLEKALTRSLKGFGDAFRRVDWRAVQSALRPDEAAIEFIRYRLYSPKPTDSVMYAALILKPGMESPEFVVLFEEKLLQAILEPLASQGRDGLNELYAGKSGQSLYQLLWKPLESALRGAKTIHFSPAGLLYRLHIDAIPTTSTTVETIGKRYKLYALGSTRQLAENKSDWTAIKPSDALIFGGIQYEIDSLAVAPNQAEESYNRNRGISFIQIDSSLRADSWRYLKYSEKEVLSIQSQLQKAGFQADVCKGTAATEESFKQIGKYKPSPKILHLSTHGFFFPDVKTQPKNKGLGIEEPIFKVSDNPMIRSGLILAGGNYAWKKGRPFENREDGILTAYEISQMDLRNTDLVVLSACETGLGQIEGNEGVYGLQRAFKIAGAKYLVMSLWQIPDFHTQELMTAFYNNLITKGMSPEKH